MLKARRKQQFTVVKRRICRERQVRQAVSARPNERVNMSVQQSAPCEYNHYITSDRYGNIMYRPVIDSVCKLKREGASQETGTHGGSVIRKRKVKAKLRAKIDRPMVRVGTTPERKLLVEDKETGEKKMIKLRSKPVYREMGGHEFKPKDGGIEV